MAGKKGKIPMNVKMKQFKHAVKYPIIEILEGVEDHRRPSLSFRYSLTSILFMTIVAVVCGATDWPKVVVMATGMKEWLAKYVDMSAGVPSERTFKNVMNMLKPEALELVLRDLSVFIRKKKSQEVISFDGQTMRGTADRQADIRGIHLVSAWSTGTMGKSSRESKRTSRCQTTTKVSFKWSSFL